MLRWAKVAQVKLLGEETTAVKNTNVPMRHAEGWDVKLAAYTGYTKKSSLRYLTEEDQRHELSVRGPGYRGGVVLYHRQRPERALAVEQFDCTPRPDYQGQWQPGLRGGRVWLTVGLGVVTLAVLVTALGVRLLRG